MFASHSYLDIVDWNTQIYSNSLITIRSGSLASKNPYLMKVIRPCIR